LRANKPLRGDAEAGNQQQAGAQREQPLPIAATMGQPRATPASSIEAVCLFARRMRLNALAGQ